MKSLRWPFYEAYENWKLAVVEPAALAHSRYDCALWLFDDGLPHLEQLEYGFITAETALDEELRDPCSSSKVIEEKLGREIRQLATQIQKVIHRAIAR